ncbi:RIP metalloprotease RseP [Paenibacillus hunanensis]|uniref:Zinc metalloprotease n=1 Tax=Paenibacillus hunanensis TaxID=539262 RepID=A0ABU1IZH9_9BACL|nr:RIP metalloprotease RseP [Paenibacillus hunanensis]MCL9660156.1 RIP metalloprotease RseP [Paenibacillus hunanensis]MDR6244676.1 regulator of sigma E protease [Paenibacillus hunanensis]GGJ22475.1 zinc metalloprotease [Paenibacillus hunanensis]
METIQVIIMTVLMFFVIVTVHEWGHYFFAKRAGVLVREFAIGFGPKLFSYKKDETVFTLRLLPFGGYARMAGEDPELADIQPGQTIAVRTAGDQVKSIFVDQLDNRRNVIRGEVQSIDLVDDLRIVMDVDGEVQTFAVHPQAMMTVKGQEIQIAPRNRHFNSASVGQRALSIFAGPAMNFILAFVLCIIFVRMTGVPVDNPQGVVLGQVTEASAGQVAGLQKGDIVEEINGVRIGGDSAKMIGMIEQSPGKAMEWKIERNGQQETINVTPKADPNSNNVGKVGVSVSPQTRPAGFTETFTQAGHQFVDMSTAILGGLKKLIFGQFQINDLAGPVGTVDMTAQVARQGLASMILWTALISTNLGIFNLLPIPALDGSRLIFIFVEWIRRKPIEPSKEGLVHVIGFAMLFLLMIAVTYNDILRLIKG